jgi:hypothetical protein
MTQPEVGQGAQLFDQYQQAVQRRDEIRQRLASGELADEAVRSLHEQALVVVSGTITDMEAGGEAILRESASRQSDKYEGWRTSSVRTQWKKQSVRSMRDALAWWRAI